MKYILFIDDGMADNPVEELGGKTPIEFANIPNVDKIASRGTVGSVRTIPEGIAPGSDTAILGILGCDVTKCYNGRGPLEAAANNIFLDPGNVGYRCNIVAFEDGDKPLEERKILSHSAGSVEGEDAVALMEYLLGQPEFVEALTDAEMKIHVFPNFRQTAVQTFADIATQKLIPPHDHLGEVCGPLLPSGCENAEKLKKIMILANKLLDKHPINERRRAENKLPANGVWFWAQGTAAALPKFEERYGKKSAAVSAVPLVQGIAALMGISLVYVEGATGEIDTNLEGKVAAALELVKENDFVVVHVEAPDECTHNGDLKGKVQSIEWLDSRVLTPLMAGLEKLGVDYRLLFVSDHKTLTSTRGHDGEPVPYLLFDSRVDNKTGAVFNEKQGEKGPFIEKGTMLMDYLFSDRL